LNRLNRIIIFGDTTLTDDIEQHLEEEGVNFLRISDVSNYEDDEALISLGFSKGEVSKTFVFMESLEINILLILSIRAIDKKTKIFTKSSNSGESRKLKLAGADEVLDFHKFTSFRIFSLIQQPNATAVLDNTIFREHGVQIFESFIDKNSKYLGVNIRDIELNTSIVLGLITNDGKFIFSQENYIVSYGDTLIVVYE